MTTAAWLLMLTTWAVIIFFTGKFFWKVLTTPQKLDPDSDPEPE